MQKQEPFNKSNHSFWFQIASLKKSSRQHMKYYNKYKILNIIRQQYNIDIQQQNYDENTQQLKSFNDLNYKIISKKSNKIQIENQNNNFQRQQYIAKINFFTKYQNLQIQNKLMIFLNQQNNQQSQLNVQYPSLIITKNKQSIIKLSSFIQNLQKEQYFVRLFKFIPGKVLYGVQFSLQNQILFQNYGKVIAKTNHLISNFYYLYENDLKISQKFINSSVWDLSNFIQIKQYLQQYQYYLINNQNHNLSKQKELNRIFKIKQLIQKYQKQCLIKLQKSKLKKCLIHSDLHKENILIKNNKIVGVIDFGDIAYSYKIFDLIIGMASSMHLQIEQKLKLQQPYYFLMPAKAILKGYSSISKIQANQFQLLYYFICARDITEYILCKYQIMNYPINDFIQKGLDQIYENFNLIFQKGYQKIQQQLQKCI